MVKNTKWALMPSPAQLPAELEWQLAAGAGEAAPRMSNRVLDDWAVAERYADRRLRLSMGITGALFFIAVLVGYDVEIYPLEALVTNPAIKSRPAIALNTKPVRAEKPASFDARFEAFRLR